MKKMIRALTVALCALGLSVASFAADQAAPANNLKVGVIDMRVVMQKSPQVAEINKSLEKEFKPREAKIVELQQKLKQETERLERDSSVMNEADRTQLQDRIIADRANLQGMVTAFRQDLSNAQNKNMQQFLDKVAGIVGKIAKDGQYDLILQGENVPYFNSRLDITTMVMDTLKK